MMELGKIKPYLVSFLYLLMFEVGSIGLYFFGEYLLSNYQLYNLHYLINPTIGFIILIFLYSFRHIRSNLSFSKQKKSTFNITLILLLLVFSFRIVTDPIQNLYNINNRINLNEIESLSDFTAEIILVYSLSSIVLIPLLEETIFRGVILKGLLKKGSDKWIAIVFSSFLFGLIHVNYFDIASTWNMFITSFIFGSIVGFIYFKQRNLWVCILFHAANNTMAFLADDMFRKEYWTLISYANFGALYWLIVMIFLVILIYMIGIYTKQIDLILNYHSD